MRKKMLLRMVPIKSFRFLLFADRCVGDGSLLRKPASSLSSKSEDDELGAMTGRYDVFSIEGMFRSGG